MYTRAIPRRTAPRRPSCSRAATGSRKSVLRRRILVGGGRGRRRSAQKTGGGAAPSAKLARRLHPVLKVARRREEHLVRLRLRRRRPRGVAFAIGCDGEHRVGGVGSLPPRRRGDLLLGRAAVARATAREAAREATREATAVGRVAGSSLSSRRPPPSVSSPLERLAERLKRPESLAERAPAAPKSETAVIGSSIAGLPLRGAAVRCTIPRRVQLPTAGVAVMPAASHVGAGATTMLLRAGLEAPPRRRREASRVGRGACRPSRAAEDPAVHRWPGGRS